ncbi:MAG: cardiolipin synthase B, partial [Spirochaetota bacterium]
MKRLGIGGMSGGNGIRLITDGDQCFDSFLRDIRRARKSINLETYIYKSDEIGWMIAEALAERARRGIEVNLMYDAVGSVGTS